MSGDQAVILNSEGTVLTTLNPVGSIVWRWLDGHRTLDELAQELSTTFDEVDRNRLATDLEKFINSLVEAGLVVRD